MKIIKKLISIIAGLFFCINLDAAFLEIYNNTKYDLLIKTLYSTKLLSNGEQIDRLDKMSTTSIPIDTNFDKFRSDFVIAYSKEIDQPNNLSKYKYITYNLINILKENLIENQSARLVITHSFFGGFKFKIDKATSSMPSNVEAKSSSDPAFSQAHLVNSLNHSEMNYLKEQLAKKYNEIAKTQEGKAKLQARFDEILEGKRQGKVLTKFGEKEEEVLTSILVGNIWK